MATATETTTAIVLAESIAPLSPAQLFAPGFIDPLLERIKSEVRAIETDISTDKGRKAVASLAYKIARTKTFIDEQRLKLVADEKKRLAAIDAEGKRVRDELDALKDEVRKPLTDWENAEKQRIANQEAALVELQDAGPYSLQNWQSLSVEAMQDRLREIQNDKRDWQEFARRGQQAKDEAIAQITEAIGKREAWDKERAELERLRKEAEERAQKEREERIAREAKEKAERQAREREERIQREAQEREARALREKQEAEDRAVKLQQRIAEAEEKAKRDAEEAERRAKAEQEAAIQRERERVEREKQAEAAAEAKREANKRHRAKINREALAALTSAGIPEAIGKTVIELIAKGEVPNVRIAY